MRSLKEFREVLPQATEPLRERIAVHAMEQLLYSMALKRTQGVQKADVQAIKERGFKARIVTKSSATLVFVAQNIRKKVLNLLKTIPACRQVLQGNKRSAIKQVFKRVSSKPLQVVSADLSKASDLIPFWVSDAIWKALSEYLGLSPEEEFVVQSTISSQELRYPNQQTIISKQGLLMGLPLTWVTLSLLHLFWLDRSMGTKSRGYAICGDDMLALMTEKESNIYHDYVAKCGGSFNAGKHVESTSFGVFLEKLIMTRPQKVPVKNDHGSRYKYRMNFKILSTFSLKFVQNEKDPNWFLKFGPATKNLILDGASESHLCAALKHSFRLKRLRSIGPRIHLDQSYGGYGVPNTLKRLFPSKRKDLLLSMLQKSTQVLKGCDWITFVNQISSLLSADQGDVIKAIRKSQRAYVETMQIVNRKKPIMNVHANYKRFLEDCIQNEIYQHQLLKGPINLYTKDTSYRNITEYETALQTLFLSASGGARIKHFCRKDVSILQKTASSLTKQVHVVIPSERLRTCEAADLLLKKIRTTVQDAPGARKQWREFVKAKVEVALADDSDTVLVEDVGYPGKTSKNHRLEFWSHQKLRR